MHLKSRGGSISGKGEGRREGWGGDTRVFNRVGGGGGGGAFRGVTRKVINVSEKLSIFFG